MNKNFYLLAPVAAMMVALPAGAQKLQSSYIEWPSSSALHTYVANWKPGTPLFEDENFFVSRVKPKAFIDRNTATQIYETITDANDKKLLFWVPIGDTNRDGVHTDALPNGLFDSEVFSSWSYITHYGDWTAPYGWVPAGFADAAHKHGVAVSGVASIPWAHAVSANNTDWGRCITGMGTIDAQKLGKFLLYHGVDGLGYNSEFTASSTQINNLNKTHADVVKYMADKNPVFENIWYSGTSDNGALGLGGSSDCLRSSLKNIFGDSENIRTSIFANYEWNSSSNINTSMTNANSLGRKLQDVYAGMNMQGGCKTATEWQTHLTTNYSIGLWGAHDFNYLWAPRAQFGSSNDDRQKTYQLLQEWWFTNGKRNPAAKMDLYPRTNLGPSAEWHGMSRMMSERSTLGWDLADEPFITYFNLGNGKFFNWKGERQNDNEWYNIGIQDYMPTWRFWFADKFLGKEPSNVPATGLDAAFTWDDAYMGGSCLRISGSTADEYLHLFRTDFTLASKDVITVRYKLNNGKANVNLALSIKNSESAIVRENMLSVFTTANCEANDEVWVEKKFTLTGQLLNALRSNPLAMIALHITDAENLDLCLGELSIVRGTSITPNQPNITLSRVLAFNRAGVDAKIIFDMPNTKAAGEPVYNLDVNTSLFRIWSQQEGCEPVNTGATSSWAALVYAAPFDHSTGTNKMRFGVQSVSLDGKSESAITWTDYLDCGTYDISEEIALNKKTIKPGENFELRFVDPQHAAAEWTITDHASGKVVYTGTGKSITTSLNDLGSYDVTVGGVLYEYFIAITAWEKGALPEINTLSVNSESADAVEISVADEFTLGYTGREADGIGSQGIEIDEGFVGCDLNNVKPDLLKSFAVGAWLNMRYPASGSRIFQIEDRRTSWPVNNWGWCWFNVNEEGVIDAFSFRRESSAGGDGIQYFYGGAQIPANAWTHLAMSFDYDGSLFRCRVFINGEELMPTEIKSATKNITAPKSADEFWITSRNYSIDYGCWLSFGGGAGSSAVYNNGVVDDLTIWNGSITADDARKAMAGLDANNLPDNVMCFWSFEEPTGTDYTFKSVGQKVGCEASAFKLVKQDKEGQAVQTPQIPVYTTGCPNIPGNGYKVETRPTWTVKRAQILSAEGNDKAGEATVKVAKSGDYKATLTLTNALGSDSRTYPVIAAALTGLDNIASANEVEAYAVDDAILVDFASAGDYTVAVYNVAGQLVAQRSASFDGNGMMTIRLNQNGVFLLNITSGDKLIRSVKLVK